MRRSYLTLVAVCTMWGTIPLVVRNVELPAAAIVSVRLWVAAAGLGALLWLRRGRGIADGPRLLSYRPGLCMAAAATLAVHWVCLFAAYQRAPAGTVILIVYLAPVGIAAAAPRLLSEHINSRTAGALAVAAAGFVLVAAPTVGRAQAGGLVLALAAAVTFVGLVIESKILAETYGGLRLAFMEMTGAGLLLVPVALRTAWGEPHSTWLWLVVLGLVHTALGTGLYLGALGRVPATHVGILGYLEPASVVLCGWLFLNQTPTAGMLAGGAMILVAGLLVLAPGAAVGRWRPVLAADGFITTTDMVLLVLALGAALVVGNVLALTRPAAKPKDGDLSRPPVARTLVMIGIGLVAAIWAIATLTT